MHVSVQFLDIEPPDHSRGSVLPEWSFADSPRAFYADLCESPPPGAEFDDDRPRRRVAVATVPGAGPDSVATPAFLRRSAVRRGLSHDLRARVRQTSRSRGAHPSSSHRTVSPPLRCFHEAPRKHVSPRYLENRRNVVCGSHKCSPLHRCRRVTNRRAMSVDCSLPLPGLVRCTGQLDRPTPRRCG